MSIQGVVEGGVVVFADGLSLPNGTPVTITPALAAWEAPAQGDPPFMTDPAMSLAERMRQLASWCEQLPTNLPADLAANHDHYLHGTPRQLHANGIHRADGTNVNIEGPPSIPIWF